MKNIYKLRNLGCQILIAVLILFSFAHNANAQATSNFWKLLGTVLQPVLNTWNVKATFFNATSTTATSTFSGDLRFDAELLPDGLTCSNGQILKKTGVNDWDCATDSVGGGSGTVSTSTNETAGSLSYWTSNSATPALLGKVATSTTGAGTGLTFSGTAGYQVGGTNGTYSVNTSQNIATLSNLTSNGYIKTSGGAGTLGVQVVPIPIADGGTNATTYSPNVLMGFDGTRLIATGTPQLTVGNLLATSTTATSTIKGGLTVGNNATFVVNPTAAANALTISPNGKVGMGTVNPLSNKGLTVSNISNPTTGATAGGILVDWNGGGGIYMVDSTDVPAAEAKYEMYGGALGVGTMSNHPVSIQAFNTTRLRINNTGEIGIGTSTSQWTLQLASSTKSQLTLSNANNEHWSFRTDSNNLSIGTSSPTTYATSTPSQISIASSGFGTTTLRGLNISGLATTTSNVGFNITEGCFSKNNTCITGTGGSGTVTSVATDSTLTGGPITTTGTLGLNLANANAWTATATTTFAGAISMQGYTFSTSTTVCLNSESCQYPTNASGAETAIQNAVNSVSGGGVVHIKKGAYTLTGQVLMENISNVTIEGDGDATILYAPSGTGVNAFMASSTTNTTFRNFRIDGTNQETGAFNASMGIRSMNNTNLVLDKMTFTNMYGFAIWHASQITGTPSTSIAKGFRLTNSYLQGLGRQDVIGGGPDLGAGDMQKATTTDVIISNNVIEQNTYAGGVIDSNMDISCINMVAVQNTLFNNNTCRGNMIFGGEQAPNSFSEINNNILYPPNGVVPVSSDIVILDYNATALTVPQAINIQNNIITAGKILITGNTTNPRTRFNITGNNITTATSTYQSKESIVQHGIYLNNAGEGNVQGNVIKSGLVKPATSLAGVYLTGVTNTQVMGNTIKDFDVGVRGSGSAGNSIILNHYLNNTANTSNESALAILSYLATSNLFGIGTSTPNWTLSVAGSGSFDDYVRASYFTATSTTATSTFAGGLDLTSSTGMGLNFGTNTLFYQNNQRFLTSSTTAAGNLTIGYQTATGLDANGGLYNTAIGYQAMGNATSTNRNTAFGYQALLGSATISNTGSNAAFGYQTLFANTTGTQNVALGDATLKNNTTGSNNMGIGRASLNANTTGGSNIGIGVNSLMQNTTGTNNIAIGTSGFNSMTSGTFNIAIGNAAGYGAGTAAIADQRSVIDTYMTFLGYQASRDASIASTTVLTNSIAIGKNARVAQSNSIVLGGTGTDAVSVVIGTTSPWAKLSILNTYGSQTPLFDIASSTSAGYATSSLFRVNADGKVGIGTTSPWKNLSVVGTMAINGLTTSTAGNSVCILSNFEVVTAGNTTCVTSSAKTKTDIKNITSEEAKHNILGLTPSVYINKEKGDRRFGFIAEQADTIDKKMVEYASEDRTLPDGQIIKKGDPSGFDYLRFTSVITKFIQDLYADFQLLVAKVSGLEKRLDEQEKEIEILKTRLDALE